MKSEAKGSLVQACVDPMTLVYTVSTLYGELALRVVSEAVPTVGTLVVLNGF